MHQLLGLTLLALLLAGKAWAETSLLERYQELRNGAGTMLPGTTICLTSSDEGKELSAEVSSIIHHPFEMVVSSLEKAENWCQFMPLHFNIKACTYQSREGRKLLTLYSGRKTYQSPDDSYEMTYRFEASRNDQSHLSLKLRADHGPVNTKDYRLEVKAQRDEEGTLLHIYSSSRPSTLSSILTHGYLSTLGRDKVGFSRIQQNGEWRLVQGVRGVIERNVMRYHLAVDSFLSTQPLPETSRHTAALTTWLWLAGLA